MGLTFKKVNIKVPLSKSNCKHALCNFESIYYTSLNFYRTQTASIRSSFIPPAYVFPIYSTSLPLPFNSYHAPWLPTAQVMQAADNCLFCRRLLPGRQTECTMTFSLPYGDKFTSLFKEGLRLDGTSGGPTPLLKQGHLEQFVQDHVQEASKGPPGRYCPLLHL